MYKALVRSHLDYCDIIYHQPPQLNQPPLGKTLTSLMAKAERVQYQAALAVTLLLLQVHGKAQIVPICMRS